MSSSKVCSSWTASVAEGDFRRIENLDFRLFLQKNKTKQNKKQNKRETRKKKRNAQSLLSCETIIYLKIPVLSCNKSVNQSVKQTIKQSVEWPLSWAHSSPVSETVNQLFWRLISIRSVSRSSSQLVGLSVAQSFLSEIQSVSPSAG